MWMILLIVLVILAAGGLPHTGFHQYGYGPSGMLFIVIVVILVMVLLGRL